MFHDFNYPAVLAASRRSAWEIDDVLPPGAWLDFTQPFLPESLARIVDLPGLGDAERLTLNHIRGHEYLVIFGLVEEFILPFLLDHLAAHRGEDEQVRALLQFAGEEAKHIHLFKRFNEAFTAGFPVRCEVIGPAAEIGAKVLGHSPLSVALAILQIEWMTQLHYLGSVQGNAAIDPLFASLLRHHWMEEAQHAKLDTLIVEALAADLTESEIDAAIDGYLAIGMFLDAGLKAQVDLNLAAFERAIGRSLDSTSAEAFRTQQHQALRWTYLGSGMTHPKFLATLSALSPTARERIEAVAPTLC